MENADADPRSTFSYIWTIENFSELTYIDLKSPSFSVKSIGDTVWYLHIDEYAGFFCSIRANNFSTKNCDGIVFKFSFLGADGSPLISKTSSAPRFFLSLMSRDKFLERWDEFLPNNTLTVQCQMWKREREIPTDLCYARTRLKTDTLSFIWAIEEFSALRSSSEKGFWKLEADERKVYPLKPLTRKGPLNALILYLQRNAGSEYIYTGFLIEKGRDCSLSYEVSVLDANGKVIESKVKRGRTDYEWAIFPIRHLISKNKLISNKNLFLPNDTLVLRCSFEICTGVTSSEIEYLTPNVSSVVEEKKEVINFRVEAAEADDSLQFGEYFIKEIDENVGADNSLKEIM